MYYKIWILVYKCAYIDCCTDENSLNLCQLECHVTVAIDPASIKFTEYKSKKYPQLRLTIVQG